LTIMNSLPVVVTSINKSFFISFIILENEISSGARPAPDGSSPRGYTQKSFRV
jgi:hypothetical protein